MIRHLNRSQTCPEANPETDYLINPMIRSVTAQDALAVVQFFSEITLFSKAEVTCLSDDLDLYLNGQYPEDRMLVYGEEQPIGLIHYGPLPITDRVWGLFWIGVDPKIQARGIGSQLLHAMEADVRSQDGRMILLETSSTQPYHATRAFYLSRSYQLVCEIPDYYSNGDHKCIFTKRLA